VRTYIEVHNRSAVVSGIKMVKRRRLQHMRQKLADEEISNMRLPSSNLVLCIQRKREFRLANTRKLARLVAAQPPNLLVDSLDITLTITTLTRISDPLPMPCTIS
jgi:hypothetical protein